MPRILRPWTAKERDWLRSVWGQVSPDACADRLGRTVMAVRDAASRFGAVPAERRKRKIGDHAEQIRRLHRRGLSGKAIAERLRLPPASLWHWMRKHGLVPHGKDPAVFRQIKRREYARVWSESSLTQARLDVHAAEAARRGWPQARSPRHADVLDALESGPKIGREVTEALGLAWDPSNGNANVTVMLRYMRARGLVASERSHTDGRQVVYRLADGIRRHVPTKERGEGRR